MTSQSSCVLLNSYTHILHYNYNDLHPIRKFLTKEHILRAEKMRKEIESLCVCVYGVRGGHKNNGLWPITSLGPVTTSASN